MSEPKLRLEWIHGRYAVCRLDADALVPDWALRSSALISITRTETELSIIAEEDCVPSDVKAERGFVALRVAGTLDFALVGILARLTGALAEANVPVLAISTYDTDLLLVKAEDAKRAVEALSHIASVPSANDS
jgi:hypothetical protein